VIDALNPFSGSAAGWPATAASDRPVVPLSEDLLQPVATNAQQTKRPIERVLIFILLFSLSILANAHQLNYVTASRYKI